MENRNGPIRLLFTNYHEKTSKDRSRKIDSGFDLSSLPLSSPHPPSTFVPSWFEEQKENQNGPIQLLFTNYQRKRHRKIDFGFDLSSHPLSFPHSLLFHDSKKKKKKRYEIVRMQNQNGPIQLLFTNYQRKRHRKINFGFDLSSHPLSFPHLRSIFPWFEEEEEEKEKKVKLYEWKIPSDYYLPIIMKRHRKIEVER